MMSDVHPIRDAKQTSVALHQIQFSQHQPMVMLRVTIAGHAENAGTHLGFCAPLCVPFSFLSPFLASTDLSLSAPDALDEAITLGQSVQGIVGLAHGADEAAEGVDVVLAGDGTARLVDLGNGDLNGGVVLGLDDAVGGRALAGDVAIRDKSSGSAHRVRSQVVLRLPRSRVAYRSTISPRSFSILTAGWGN